MHYIYPGMIGKVFVAPPAVGSAFISARYWKIDNITRESGGTTIYGITLWKGDTILPDPATMVANTGDFLNLWRSRRNGDSGVNTTMDTITDITFDFGTNVSPDRVALWGVEWDVNYIDSFDISYSHDNVTFHKIGHWDDATQTGESGWRDNTEYFNPMISSHEYLGNSHAEQNLVLGRRSEAQVAVRAEVILIMGRMNVGTYAATGHLYVITTPDP